MQSTGIGREEVAPARKEVAPAREEVAPAREEVHKGPRGVTHKLWMGRSTAQAASRSLHVNADKSSRPRSTAPPRLGDRSKSVSAASSRPGIVFHANSHRMFTLSGARAFRAFRVCPPLLSE